jgi:U4/U6.U5 tri-snRNP-associated protein 1
MGGRGDDRGGDAGGGDAGGGDIAMSIEETNKLRISLGLKPLAETTDTDTAAKDEHKKRKRAEEDASNAAELEERVRSTRERRKQQEVLTKTKTLGEAEPEVDDVMAWVSKSRKVEETTKSAPKSSRRSTRTKKVDDDEEGGDGADALAGAKVKFGVDDLEAGEEMILTLEDQGILDDKGQLIEDDDQLALENIQKREDKQRAKAFQDSRKTAKPLWEEDGQKRSLLDKYDQEEEEAFQLDDAGAIEASKLRRQDDIRAKLAAAKANGGVAGAMESNEAAQKTGNSDYYTPEEMAAMRKPKKKKERKLKKKALTADELTALEEAAAAAGGGGSDLGSRADRERRAAEKDAAVLNADQERRARFDAALTKANYASLALKSTGEEDGADGDEGEDDDLYRSLQKARELASKKTQQQPQETAGNQFILKREPNSGAVNGGGALPSLAGGLTFTDIGEFTRGITVKEENGAVPVKIAPDALEKESEEGGASAAAAAATAIKKENDDEMTKIEEEMGIQTAAVPMEEDAKPADGAWGNWMPAAEAEAAAAAANVEQKAKRSYRRNRATDEQDEDDGPKNRATDAEANANVGGEKTIGSGLAGALAFLKDRGELKAPVEWAGRTNDHRDSYFTKAMGNLEDVYSGGRTEDRLALDVEVALTKKDEFGRILTPKEAFRQLCHDFHGIKPSRNSKEKRAKQVAKELAQRKTASGAAGGTLDGLKAVQEAGATPYMVLSGTVRPGQSRDAASGYATVDRRGGGDASIGGGGGGSMSAVPRLGGQQGPPLTGKAKVEAMLGMMPPPPRPPQQHQQGGAGSSKK